MTTTIDLEARKALWRKACARNRRRGYSSQPTSYEAYHGHFPLWMPDYEDNEFTGEHQ